MKNILLILFLLMNSLLYSQSFFLEAENFLLENKLDKASVLFEKSINEEKADNANAYIYLGYIYEVKKEYKTAIRFLQEGLMNTSGEDYKIYFNLGNNYFKEQDYDNALLMYTKALELEQNFAESYLNRANSYVKKEEYSLAISDYEVFTRLRPNDPKSNKINKIKKVIKTTIADNEKRIKEEEIRKEAEEARKKALLDSVLSTFDDVGENLTNLSADSETIKDVEIELDIED